jgi:hypothetical protein
MTFNLILLLHQVYTSKFLKKNLKERTPIACIPKGSGRILCIELVQHACTEPSRASAACSPTWHPTSCGARSLSVRFVKRCALRARVFMASGVRERRMHCLTAKNLLRPRSRSLATLYLLIPLCCPRLLIPSLRFARTCRPADDCQRAVCGLLT